MSADLIQSGAWVETRWGPAVCIQRHPDFCTYCYEAERMSGPHQGEVIWVENGDPIAKKDGDPDWHVRSLRPADDTSRRVLDERGSDV